MLNKQVSPYKLVEINPRIRQHTRRYISGTTKEALELFLVLCSERIYIDGFIDDEYAGKYFYTKQVFNHDEVYTTEDSIVLLTKDEILYNNLNYCTNIFYINTQFDSQNVYIYGAGYIGCAVLKYFEHMNIEVKGFIDSDENKVGMVLSGKIIFGKEILYSLKDNTSIVEAGGYYKQIDKIISDIRPEINRFYCEKKSDLIETAGSRSIVVDHEKGIVMRYKSIFDMLDIPLNKKIILYGDDEELAYKYYEIYKLFDYKDICVVSRKELSDDKVQRIACIEEALYEKDYIIIVYDGSPETYYKKLKKIGLEIGEDCFCVFRSCNIRARIGFRKQIWDVNCGYTYLMNHKYPGIYVFGQDASNNYKIAILGGSTSDSGLYTIKSWVQIFYERYCVNNNVTVYNGAIAGYDSAQELVKLMRDIVELEPDLVIVYDGFNDVGQQYEPGSSGIWGFPYFINVLKNISDKMMDYEYVHKCDSKYIWGGSSCVGREVDCWLKNVQYMHAVSEMNNITFYDFMQPSLVSKANLKTSHEIALYKGCEYGVEGSSFDAIKEFRRRAENISKEYDYIYDLTHIFDEEDVYYDSCHVNECGNQIIADEIYKVVMHEIGKQRGGQCDENKCME